MDSSAGISPDASNRRSRLRVALVCLTPDIGAIGSPHELPSYGIRRILASVLADPDLSHCDTELIDSRDHQIGDGPEGIRQFVEAIEKFNPDVVGFSVYLWSFPTLLEVAQHLKRNRRDRTIVMGGPSARPAMLSLEPFRHSLDFVDALVIADGEDVFREIVALNDRGHDSLARIRGIAVPTSSGWKETEKRPPLEPLDRIASPYQMGLMPKGQVAFLETYRGCPLSCRFCEWGISGDARRIFSKEYIAREMRAFKEHDSRGVFLLDAGLNLNIHAFRNLRAAEEEVQFFSEEAMICEVYPSQMNEEYFDFLRKIRRPPYIGVGLQSFNRSVLDLMQRTYDESRFESVVRRLTDLGLPVEIQLILGLPGDNLLSFIETFERARALGVDVRVFHALVLPDALMTRSLPEFDIKFDPYSLKIISCLGWSEEDLQQARVHLAKRSLADQRFGGAPNEELGVLALQPYLDILDRPNGSFYPTSGRVMSLSDTTS